MSSFVPKFYTLRTNLQKCQSGRQLRDNINIIGEFWGVEKCRICNKKTTATRSV